MYRILSVVVLLCSALATGQTSLPKVSLGGSELRSLHSSNTGRDYDLYVKVPGSYEKESGKKYPVLYVLDGQWDFKLMDSIVGGLVYDKFMPEAIIVGITYSGEHADYNALRAMDYTPVAMPDPKGSGGAPKFYAFVKDEMIPYVESKYRINAKRRVLTGSSYAGIFTLYALFSDPSLFYAYVSLSPAVSFGNRFAFKQETEFAKAHRELPVRLYLAVGGQEELTGPVKEYMKLLSGHAYKGLKLETRVIEGERHASNKPEGYNRGLRWVFEGR